MKGSYLVSFCKVLWERLSCGGFGILSAEGKVLENSPTNTSEIISFLKYICKRYCRMGWNRQRIGLGFGLCFIYFTFQQFLCIKDPNQTLTAFLTPCKKKEECAYLEVKRMNYRIGTNRVITLVLNTCCLPSSHQYTDLCFFCESNSIRKLVAVWAIKWTTVSKFCSF